METQMCNCEDVCPPHMQSSQKRYPHGTCSSKGIVYVLFGETDEELLPLSVSTCVCT